MNIHQPMTLHLNGFTATIHPHATRAEVQHLIDVLTRGWRL